MGFSRQESWSGFPTPGDLPDPGIEPGSPALQAESLPSKPPGKPMVYPNWGTRERGAFDTDTRTAAVRSGCPGPQGRVPGPAAPVCSWCSGTRAPPLALTELPPLAQPLHRDQTRRISARCLQGPLLQEAGFPVQGWTGSRAPGHSPFFLPHWSRSF